MIQALTRLLTIIALIWMPHSMAGARAMTEAAHHVMVDGHHSEPPTPGQFPVSQQPDCGLACAALPAGYLSQTAISYPSAPPALRPIEPIIGTEPEIATPPPKLA